jgi:hypothetical protein
MDRQQEKEMGQPEEEVEIPEEEIPTEENSDESVDSDSEVDEVKEWAQDLQKIHSKFGRDLTVRQAINITVQEIFPPMPVEIAALATKAADAITEDLIPKAPTDVTESRDAPPSTSEGRVISAVYLQQDDDIILHKDFGTGLTSGLKREIKEEIAEKEGDGKDPVVIFLGSGDEEDEPDEDQISRVLKKISQTHKKLAEHYNTLADLLPCIENDAVSSVVQKAILASHGQAVSTPIFDTIKEQGGEEAGMMMMVGEKLRKRVSHDKLAKKWGKSQYSVKNAVNEAVVNEKCIFPQKREAKTIDPAKIKRSKINKPAEPVVTER